MDPLASSAAGLRRAVALTRCLGWIMLMAAISKSAGVIAPLILLTISGRAAGIMALYFMPVWLLTVAGAVGLIRVRRWGFYMIYAASVLSLFLANVPYVSGMTLLPLIDRWLRFGPLNSYALQTVNFLMVGCLAWSHWRLHRAIGGARPSLGVMAAFGLGSAALCSVAVWWNWCDYKTGSVPSLGGVEPIGAGFQNFKAEGPVNIRGAYHRRFRGVMLVASGIAEEGMLTNFVSTAKLNPAPMPQALPKRLPLAKNWRLREDVFTREFGERDRGWVGRLPGHRKVVVQVWWRPADRHFTMEVFGILSQ